MMRVICVLVVAALSVPARAMEGPEPDIYRVRGLQKGESISLLPCPQPGCHIGKDPVATIYSNGTVLIDLGETVENKQLVRHGINSGWIARDNITTGTDIAPDCRDVVYYRVKGVRNGDTLSVRMGPGPQFPKVGDLHHADVNVENDMSSARPYECSWGWVRISKSQPDNSGTLRLINGWVNRSFLIEAPFAR